VQPCKIFAEILRDPVGARITGSAGHPVTLRMAVTVQPSFGVPDFLPGHTFYNKRSPDRGIPVARSYCSRGDLRCAAVGHPGCYAEVGKAPCSTEAFGQPADHRTGADYLLEQAF